MPEPGLSLRDRLSALRAHALARMAAGKQIDSGMLTLVAHVGAALEALDAEAAATVVSEPAARAVVLDDNLQITVAVFTADRQAAATVLTPAAAIRLGNKLVAAGIRRL